MSILLVKDGLIDIIDYRGKTPPKSSSGIPLISAANIKNGELIFDKQAYISEKNYKTWAKRGFTKEDDVLITTEAPPGEVALYPPSKKYQISRRVMALRTNEKKLHNKYLFYLLQSPHIKAQLLSANRGSTVPRLLKTDITEFPIFAPDINLQRRIATILSTLDAKIDLLRRQNHTLEQIAQTLFKRWFVAFDFPNKDGQPYQSSGGPMVPSELGEIPEGWRVGTLGEILHLNYGKGLRTGDRKGGEYLVVGSNGVVDNHNEYLVQAPGIVIGRKGTIGKVIWLNDNFFPIDTTFYVTDNLGLNELYFHYFVLLRQQFNRIGSDSAVPGLNRNLALGLEEVIPELDLIKKFNVIIKPIFNKIYLNTTQIQTLTRLRDTLLPKLMSGQLRVKGD